LHYLGGPFALKQQAPRAASALLMQHFPKGMKLTDITEEQVQEAVEQQPPTSKSTRI
jgi:hypothetical protein